MNVIAYAYEADHHCIDCTRERFGGSAEADQNGVPIRARDNEGNPVHPVFDTDEQFLDLVCGDCGEVIEVIEVIEVTA